eukprot:3784855-Rhodomonas_salina.3
MQCEDENGNKTSGLGHTHANLNPRTPTPSSRAQIASRSNSQPSTLNPHCVCPNLSSSTSNLKSLKPQPPSL